MDVYLIIYFVILRLFLYICMHMHVYWIYNFFISLNSYEGTMTALILQEVLKERTAEGLFLKICSVSVINLLSCLKCYSRIPGKNQLVNEVFINSKVFHFSVLGRWIDGWRNFENFMSKTSWLRRPVNPQSASDCCGRKRVVVSWC